MSGYNGSGVFSFTYNWVNDANNAIPITASRMDTEFADATGGFNLVICRDGQSTTTGVIPFAAGISVGGGATMAKYDNLTWTPTDASGAALSLTVTRASYVRLGSVYLCDVTLTYPATADGSSAKIGGLPGTYANVAGVGGVFVFSIGSSFVEGVPVRNTTTFSIVNSAGAAVTNAQMSGLSLFAQFMIFTV